MENSVLPSQFKKLKKDISQLWGKHIDDIRFKLFLSALVDINPLNSTSELKDWLNELNRIQYFEVEEIEFAAMKQWAFHPDTGDLQHKSGKFFSIRGMNVLKRDQEIIAWDQPVIDQPEIGVLGILAKEIDGVLCFLMQAKAEPGNLNTYQLSPTVQATRSNYMQVHGGRKTKYIEYFNGDKDVFVVLDQYQSEQGSRFYNKRNRNILVVCDEKEEIELSENHRWLTLGQLKSLLEEDNAVNMDTRSILSMIDYSIEGFTPQADTIINVLSNYRDIITRSDIWMKTVCGYLCEDHKDISKQRNALTWKRYYHPYEKKFEHLSNINDWAVNEASIEHKGGKFFKVIAVRINANNREVDSWDQPIIKQRYHGKIMLFCKESDNGLDFLIQMKHEPGLHDMIEFAPSLQCITENYEPSLLPCYHEMNNRGRAVYSAYQSEEGGRFYKESSLNQIRIMDLPAEIESNFCYMNLSQLKQMVQYQQMLNVELRSLLAYF